MKPNPVELRLTPVDNQRLANLCGVLDENLRQIENALDVSIARRGDSFRLETSTNLTTWQPLANLTATNQPLQFTDTSATEETLRYCRARR